MTADISKHARIAVAAVVGIIAAAVVVAMFVSQQAGGAVGGAVTITDPMQLSGSWLGMSVMSPNAGEAQELGAAFAPTGVVVAEVQASAVRVRQAGIMPGDVIVGVNGTAVGDMADLFDLSLAVDVAGPVQIDLLRWGQPLKTMLPPIAATAVAPPALAGIAPAPVPGGAMPVAWAAPPAGGGAGPYSLYCPQDGTAVPAGAAPVYRYRCPRCAGPLVQGL